jgi:proline-specific peptidase
MEGNNPMSATFARHEGYVDFRGHRTWYRIVGERAAPGKLPLLCLHGGPGAPSYYLEPLERMAATGRQVVFYDQLGCGRSDQPSDPSMWTIDLFLDELRTVREALSIDHVHILGQSWGGMLLLEYALTRPEGVASITLASTASSIPAWAAEANRLLGELPADVQETIRTHEVAGTTGHPDYERAGEHFYRRHVCRTDPWPDYFTRAIQNLRAEVYTTMWGPSEFSPTGTLRDWDVTDRLGEITIPTLVTCGRHDEASPALAETIQQGIPGARLAIIEDASHMAHGEQNEEYLRVLTAFLEEVER